MTCIMETRVVRQFPAKLYVMCNQYNNASPIDFSKKVLSKI